MRSLFLFLLILFSFNAFSSDNGVLAKKLATCRLSLWHAQNWHSPKMDTSKVFIFTLSDIDYQTSFIGARFWIFDKAYPNTFSTFLLPDSWLETNNYDPYTLLIKYEKSSQLFEINARPKRITKSELKGKAPQHTIVAQTKKYDHLDANSIKNLKEHITENYQTNIVAAQQDILSQLVWESDEGTSIYEAFNNLVQKAKHPKILKAYKLPLPMWIKVGTDKLEAIPSRKERVKSFLKRHPDMFPKDIQNSESTLSTLTNYYGLVFEEPYFDLSMLEKHEIDLFYKQFSDEFLKRFKKAKEACSEFLDPKFKFKETLELDRDIDPIIRKVQRAHKQK